MIGLPSSPGVPRSSTMFARSAPSSTTRTGLISRLGKTKSADDALEAMAASPLRGPCHLNDPSTENVASRITTNHEGLMNP